MAKISIDYTPPLTIRSFIRSHKTSQLFYNWIIGPVGSGKTTALFMKLIHLAKKQAPSQDGIRRTRAVVVRNTMPQLKDTTLVSWGYWFKDGIAGKWNATDKIFTLKYADVVCEVLFRPLDTPDDVARVLSLEINFAILDEFVEIPKPIVDALSARLGRYKQPDGTLVTIWGMWGSSNPSTEDNWWFDYLHGDAMLKWTADADEFNRRKAEHVMRYGSTPNAIYFHQPSGFSEQAENLENLPGNRGYYSQAAKGKSDAWVKQFIEAQWGFSIAGQPVVPQFREEVHVARRPLQWNKHKPLIVSLDPGIAGSAMLLWQDDYDGRINIYRELVQEGYGAQRLIEERLIPVLRQDFHGAEVIIVPDPAAANRTPTDEGSVVKIFKRYFQVEVESNNRFPLRLNAIEHFTSKLIQGTGAVQIDPRGCPVLIRALKGGWRYTADLKKDILKGSQPDKNPFSHVGDAFGYFCRYFHKGVLREEKYGISSKGGFRSPPRQWKPPNYHAR